MRRLAAAGQDTNCVLVPKALEPGTKEASFSFNEGNQGESEMVIPGSRDKFHLDQVGVPT